MAGNKPLVCFVAALLLAAPTSLAQLGWGIMGGVQLSNITSDLPSDNQVGFQAGFFGEVDALLVGARAEAVISSKGAEVQIDFQDPINGLVVVKSKVDLLYLDIPLMFNVSPEGAVEIYVGPLASIKLDDRIESRIIEGDLSVPVEDIERELKFNGIDFGLALGLGVNLSKFDLGARYNLGIDTAGKYQVGSLSGEFSNRALVFYVGYRFTD